MAVRRRGRLRGGGGEGVESILVVHETQRLVRVAVDFLAEGHLRASRAIARGELLLAF